MKDSQYEAVSLFDGMSCGRLALDSLGLGKVDYFASEIDRHSIDVSKTNWSDITQMGDIRNMDYGKLPKSPDILMGGSPCQGFSILGKGLSFDHPKSKLFFDYLRVRDNMNPKYFLLENVRPRRKEWTDIITSYMGVEPIVINSSLASAQNRERYYWTNIPVDDLPDSGIMVEDYDGELFDRGRRPTLGMTMLERQKRSDTRQIGYLGGLDRSGKRVYLPKGKLPTLLANSTGGNNPLWLYNEGEGQVFRAHINLCEWLQNVPRDYTKAAALNQRYKMLGNGWTVRIIAHILKNAV